MSLTIFALDGCHLPARTTAAVVTDNLVGIVEGGLVDAVGVYLADNAAFPVVFLVGPQETARVIVTRRVPVGVDLGRDA